MIRFSLLILFFSSTGHAITLKEAVDKSYANDNQILIQKQKLIEANESYSSAIAAAFPKVDGTLSASYKKDSVALTGSAPFGGDAYNFYSAQLSLLQPLYRGGAIWAAYKYTDLNQSVEELKLEELKRSVGSNTISSYLNTLQAKRKLDALLEVEKIDKESLSLTEKRQRIGRSQTLDLLQSKTVLALLSPKISQAKSDLLTLTSNLAKTVNALDQPSINLDNEIAEFPIEQSIQITKSAELPSIERLKVVNNQASYQSDIDLAKYYPQLNLLGNIGRNTYRKADLVDSHYTAWSVGLQLQIPIFSGLSSFSDRKLSAAKMAEATLNLNDAIQSEQLNSIVSLQEFENAKTIYQSTKVAYDLAKESLEEAKKNYRYSTIDYAQYLSIQQNFLDALIALDQAKVSIWIMLNKHMIALGKSCEDFINIYSTSLKGETK